MQTLKTQKTFWLILCVAVFCSCTGFGKEKTTQNFNDIETYNVVWDSPSKDSSGSMPIGSRMSLTSLVESFLSAMRFKNSRIRSFISKAALLVNVIARM